MDKLIIENVLKEFKGPLEYTSGVAWSEVHMHQDDVRVTFEHRLYGGSSFQLPNRQEILSAEDPVKFVVMSIEKEMRELSERVQKAVEAATIAWRDELERH